MGWHGIVFYHTACKRIVELICDQDKEYSSYR